MSAIVNFIRARSVAYAEVQRQLLDAIQAEMPDGSHRETIATRRDGALNVSLFIRQPADVIMSHGAADKNYFFMKDEAGGRIARNLRHVLVPGEWLRRRILDEPELGLGPDQVHVVGWPRLDALLRRQAQTPNPPRGARRPRVLWAPTHDFARRGDEQVSTSSYPELLDHMDALRRHLDIEMSLHPRNRNGGDRTPTGRSLIDCDLVISDFGTLVYEAWALGKPVIFPSWIIGERITRYLGHTAEGHIYREGLGLHARSPGELIDMANAATGVDDRTQAFIDAYLAPQWRGKSARRVADVLMEMSGG